MSGRSEIFTQALRLWEETADRSAKARELVALGTSLLSAGHRVTVLDLTGQQVGDGLVTVARLAGMRTRTVTLTEGGGANVDLLSGVRRHDIARHLGAALGATEVLHLVVESLDGAISFARLAAGVRVLRDGTRDHRLSPAEVDRLVGRGWAFGGGVLHVLAERLDRLHDVAPAGFHGRPLWMDEPVSLIATDGDPLLGRVLIRLAEGTHRRDQDLDRMLLVELHEHVIDTELLQPRQAVDPLLGRAGEDAGTRVRAQDDGLPGRDRDVRDE